MPLDNQYYTVTVHYSAVHSDITSLPLCIIMVLFMQPATKTPEL